jgi:monovalent cation:H+ antiporter, CPA1 family
MSVFQVIAVLLTLTALFSYLNYRFIRLPTTIGVMLIALIASLALIVLQHFGVSIGPMAARVLQSVDFDQTLLQGMLSFLLFAGALHINLNDLAKQKWVITILAVVGVLISTFVFGTAIYLMLAWLNLKLSYAWCLLFGALISPTDPIAVLGVLKSAKVPKSLEIQIAGESLFNDGIGVVVFLVLYEIAVRGDQPSFAHIDHD